MPTALAKELEMRSTSPRRAPRSLAALAALALVSASPQENPKPDDGKTIDSAIAALYEVISGPAGKERDWDRFRALFVPGARLIPAGRTLEGDGAKANVLTPDEFAERAGEAVKRQGFFESEIHRRAETFGPIAHVWSTYESRHAEGEDPFIRGINSIQLLRDGDHWRIVTIYWTAETPENPIPAEYLPKE
jgi:hypothetical protein